MDEKIKQLEATRGKFWCDKCTQFCGVLMIRRCEKKGTCRRLVAIEKAKTVRKSASLICKFCEARFAYWRAARCHEISCKRNQASTKRNSELSKSKTGRKRTYPARKAISKGLKAYIEAYHKTVQSDDSELEIEVNLDKEKPINLKIY